MYGIFFILWFVACIMFGTVCWLILLVVAGYFPLPKHIYSNILKILSPEKKKKKEKKKKENSDENSKIFHISAESIDCGYSLEPSQRG